MVRSRLDVRCKPRRLASFSLALPLARGAGAGAAASFALKLAPSMTSYNTRETTAVPCRRKELRQSGVWVDAAPAVKALPPSASVSGMDAARALSLNEDPPPEPAARATPVMEQY